MNGTATAEAPSPWRLKTAANGITVTRIVATPLLILVVLWATPSWGALLLWAALAFSDFADGWLARRRGPSASGAFLDPLADKFLVLGALAAMVAIGDISWAPVALLGGRELVITSYRVICDGTLNSSSMPGHARCGPGGRNSPGRLPAGNKVTPNSNGFRA